MFLKILQSSQAKAYNFIKKDTLAQVFSCEFCEFLSTPFFYGTPLLATSELHKIRLISLLIYESLKNEIKQY